MDGQIDLFDEIIVDNFAGGGGASTGIELATGRPVNIAINHDPDAILMHKTNHPYTEHYQASVWDINPEEVCQGRKVGLAWFSPDCKHFSKAKGGKPVDKKIRGLAWIVLRWAAKVRPRVIMLENVEEFQTWGPVRKGKPVKSKVGQTFNQFIEQLKALDYDVEYRELKACDYGAPTIRKRFFLIARCDGNPIVWPEATHAPADSEAVKRGLKLPYHTAAECIDWSIPAQSIFERKKPLAENTMRRIARGIQKFVIDNPEPFIVTVNHSGEGFRGQSTDEPLGTITAKNGYGVVTPTIMCNNTNNVGASVNTPLPTVTAIDHNALSVPFLTQYYSGADHANTVTNPLQTVTVKPRHFLNDCFLTVLRNHMDSKSINEPLNTITARAMHFTFVKVSVKQYSEDVWLGYWQKIRAMLNEYTDWNLNDNEIIVFNIDGTEYFIYDIGMRMLQPKELYAAQGFPKDYVIEKDYLGNTYPKSKQVARCGNAVPPPFATALVRANLPEYCDTYILTMADLMERMAI